MFVKIVAINVLLINQLINVLNVIDLNLMLIPTRSLVLENIAFIQKTKEIEITKQKNKQN